MASLWKHPESKYWTACFRDSSGKQRRVSTKETDRKKAKRIADEYEKGVRTKRTLRQTQRALFRLHEEISGEPVSQKSLRTYATEWLAAKAPEIDVRTYDSYSSGLTQLLGYLGPRADAPIGDLTKAEFVAYRNSLSATVSATTTNNHLALVKMLFKSAQRDVVCSANPVEFIGYVRAAELPATAWCLHSRLYIDSQEAELRAAQSRARAANQRDRGDHLHSGRGPQSARTLDRADSRRPREGSSRRSLSHHSRRARHAGRERPPPAPVSLRRQAS